MLTTYLEDIMNVEGASGQGKPRLLQFSRRKLLTTRTLMHPASPMKHLPLWIYPSLIPPYLQERERLRRRVQARAWARAGAGPKG